MIIVGLSIVFSPNLVASYLLVALVCCFFQWRYLQRAPEEAPAPSPASASPGAHAVQATQAPVTTGMVSASYVQRASAAIGQAVPRLYGPLVLPWGLWIAGGRLVLFVVEKNFFFLWSEAAKELALLGLTGAAWFVVERRASASLMAILGAELYERLKGQCRRRRRHPAIERWGRRSGSGQRAGRVDALVTKLLRRPRRLAPLRRGIDLPGRLGVREGGRLEGPEGVVCT
jgi:hypothetical protein